MSYDQSRAQILRLAEARRRAQAEADERGKELREAIRSVAASKIVRPAEIARWLEVTPQYVSQIIHSEE